MLSVTDDQVVRAMEFVFRYLFLSDDPCRTDGLVSGGLNAITESLVVLNFVRKLCLIAACHLHDSICAFCVFCSRMKLVVEPAAATGVAALLDGQVCATWVVLVV